MRRFLHGLGGFALATTLTLGAASGAQAKEKIQMTIGYQALWATVGEVFETLRHTNILALNGIDAKFQTFTYGGPLGEGYVAGHIDSIIAADAPVLRGLARRPGKVLHRTHDWRWGVVAVKDFPGKSLADLKSKKLAGPFGTTVFPRTVNKLVAAGIKDPFRELTIINQDVAEQATALQGKLVDAVVTWDPTMSKLINSGMAKPIYESQVGEGLGWQGLSQDFLNKYGEDGAVRFLKSWIMAIWWASNNMDQAQGWFAKTSRIPADLLKASQMNDRYLKAPVKDIKSIDLTIIAQEIKDAQAVMDFQVEQKLMTHKMDVASFVDMSYLKKSQAEIAAGRHPALDKIKVTSN
jgi:ABC-type nitrate/sulfonate/bicarbonate transport system substrate-binding protein